MPDQPNLDSLIEAARVSLRNFENVMTETLKEKDRALDAERARVNDGYEEWTKQVVRAEEAESRSDIYMMERDAAEARLSRVRELHGPRQRLHSRGRGRATERTECAVCIGQPYPCDTIAALDTEDPA
jgi:hypothetical protein